MNKTFELQQFNANDFEFYFKLVSNIKVMEMITECVIPIEEARLDFAKLLDNNRLHLKFGSFKIVDRENGEFIGLAKLELETAVSTVAELGYMILPAYWGKGIGSQIAKNMLEIAKEQDEIKKVVAIIDPLNIASRKILVNHGFVSVEFKDFDGLAGEILELELN